MRVFRPAAKVWKSAGMVAFVGGMSGWAVMAEGAEARERKAAPIEFAGGARAEPRQAPAAQVTVPTQRSGPQLSYRYADQPDVVYGYGAGAPGAPNAPGPQPIDLRVSPANDNAPVGTYVGRAFDARRVAAENDNAPQPLVITPANATRAAAPAAPPASGRPEWLEQERAGAPYQANNQWYVPTAEPGYAQSGKASWYGPEFEGRKTASGEVYRSDALSAAHPTLPIPSLVQVTNLENGKEVILRVNDRGPFVDGRLIDVSRRAAEVLGFVSQGHAQVHVRYLGPAPKRVDGARQPAADADAPVSSAAPLGPAVNAAPSPQRALPAQTGAGQGFVVQVGAFSQFANAERARASLRSEGVVSIESRPSANGAVHRVRLGPWGDRDAAEAARNAAAARGFTDAVVAALP